MESFGVENQTSPEAATSNGRKRWWNGAIGIVKDSMHLMYDSVVGDLR